MVRVLLEQEGIDISHQNQDGYTALMKAVEVGDVDVMKILMERYSNEETGETSGEVSNPRSLKPIDAVNLNGMTAEQIADKHGLGNIFHILKTHLINQVSPLVLAVGGKDIESLNMLLNCHFVEKQDINDALVEICSSHVTNLTRIPENRFLMTKRLLENGADVNTSRNVDSISLSAAVKLGNYNRVKDLCEQLYKPQHEKSPCGTHVLVTAATSGHWNIVKLVFNYKTDVDNIYNYYDSPLDCALRHGHLEIAQLLIQHGAKMDIISALQSAVTHQLPEYMKFLSENYRTQVIHVATKGGIDLNKLLVSAAQGGNLEIIGHLLDAGADVNHEAGNEETPLGESKDGNVAKFLIHRGANANLVLQNGDNILLQIVKDEIMKYSSKLEVVKVLLENGASVNERGIGGMTPLMAAASRTKHVSVLQILLDHGADMSAQDDEGNTALMKAVSLDCPINVSFLLEFHRVNKLSINVQNHRGKTALMYAVLRNRLSMMKQMISLGADVTLKDIDGNTALLILSDYYSLDEWPDTLETMIKAGSDVNCLNNEGFSPLMLAAKNCRIKTILILFDSGADVNAVSKVDRTKTALFFLKDSWHNRTNFKLCLQAFLKKGANLSYINSHFIHDLIFQYPIDFISERIQGSIGPVDVNSKKYYFEDIVNEAITTVSPLCVALLHGNVPLARYLVGNMFLTSSDVCSLAGNKNFRRKLEKKLRHDCLIFLDELSSQPWFLFQLTFVSVLSAVGSSPGRENRVNMLPLPKVMKDKLLFKSQKLQLNSPSQGKDYFEEVREVNNPDLSDSPRRDSDNINLYDWLQRI